MLLNLTDLSNEPLQSQIYQQIRAMILSGDLQAGTMLPSIRRLAREEKVSVITVQRGYEILEKEGLILSRRGKGFFVSDLHTNKKKELIEHRLVEKLEPIIKVAQNEGMSRKEIGKIVTNILKKN
ncbi:MAG: GntR family transcriptional regulator [Melioribacteraceae bacterium]|nr:GntR family transcriptional regulator [Melioribacteraceae bacterium]